VREFAVQQSDQSLRETFFRSITLMTSVSSIILCGCEGTLYPAGITPLIAIVSWVIVDNKQWVRIPVIVGNILSLGALVAASMEFYGGTLERKLLSGAHLIVYLTWVVLLLPKGIRQFWWLIALSVLQIAVSGILSSGVGFGFAMVGMMLLLLWTMSVFSLFRVQSSHAMSVSSNGSFSEMSSVPRRRSLREFFDEFFGLSAVDQSSQLNGVGQGQNDAMVRDGLQRDPSEVWVGFRFRSMVAGSYVVSLILAVIVFAAFPRVWIPGTSLWSSGERDQNGQNRTGFSESVELGDIGTIMESNERVLAFDIRNLKADRRATVEEYCDALQMDEVRFRGNAFACYKEGRWTQGFVEHGFSAEGYGRPGSMVQRPAEYRLEVVQDPPFSAFVFAPRPVSRVRGKGTNRVAEGQVSETLVWAPGNRGTSERTPRAFTIENCLPVANLFLTPEKQIEFLAQSNDQLQKDVDELLSSRAEFYTAFYTMNGNFVARNQQMVLGQRRRWSYSPVNDAKELYPQIWNLARNICMENGGLVPPQERVNRILSFLSPESGFKYSRTQQRVDRSLDPLVDFILNTKTGHCEYFASACTLMLQCAEVPARLINGYYGCEVNGLTGKYEVRQRHAHAWVESYLNHEWITLEPTPSAQRQAEVAEASDKSIISDLRHALSDFWNDGIQQMSAERQQEFFAPVISTSKSLLDTIREQGLWTTFKTSATQFVRDPQSWFSWQGGVVTFVFLLMIGGLIRINAFDRLWKFLQRWRSSGGQDSSTRSAIRFYEGFCSVCERQGLKFAPSNSAMENAKLAATELGWKLTSDELRQVPQRIANAFNAVRYGHQSLTEEQVASIGNDLNSFAEALKNPQTA
jgi:transglutaminase-like putative cysteine protease